MVMSVKGHKEDPGVAQEHILRGVAMVNIPIKHKNPLDIMFFHGHRSSHPNIIEQAKSHGGISLCVVTRGSHHRNATSQLPSDHLFFVVVDFNWLSVVK